MGTDTIPIVVPIALVVVLYICFIAGMVSFLRTECRPSHQPFYHTNLDLVFPNGAATASWKKLIVGTLMALLSPIVCALAVLAYIISKL